MKSTWKFFLTVLMASLRTIVGSAVLLGGCTAHQSAIEGHDFLDAGLANIEIGLAEQTVDDADQEAVVEKKLAEAFAADVVKIADDKAAVGLKTAEFIGLLHANRQAFAAKGRRARNMFGTVTAMREVVDSLRQLQQLRLGWQTEAVKYAAQLRERLEKARLEKATGK